MRMKVSRFKNVTFLTDPDNGVSLTRTFLRYKRVKVTGCSGSPREGSGGQRGQLTLPKSSGPALVGARPVFLDTRYDGWMTSPQYAASSWGFMQRAQAAGPSVSRPRQAFIRRVFAGPSGGSAPAEFSIGGPRSSARAKVPPCRALHGEPKLVFHKLKLSPSTPPFGHSTWSRTSSG